MTDEDWMVLLTAMLAVIGFIQVIVTAITLRGLRHARIAAEAASRSADVATDTAKRQLRAYVTPKSVHIEGWRVGNPTPASVVMEYENVGQTPANRTKCWFAVLVALSPDPDFELGEPDAHSEASIFPGQGGSLHLEIPAPQPADWARFLAGELRIFVHGKVEYVDVFGMPHRTAFKYEHDRTRRKGHFGTCPGGNEAD